MSQTMFTLAIFAVCFVAMSVGGPLHKRSVPNSVVEFSMDNTIAKDDELEAYGNSTKEEFHQMNCSSADVSTNELDPIYKRSTCPWYYKAEYDPTFFPANILNAIPVCTYCLGSGGKLECTPITQELVGLKQANDDSSVWRHATKNVTVGFTCTGRRLGDNQAESQPQPSITTLPPVDYENYA